MSSQSKAIQRDKLLTEVIEGHRERVFSVIVRRIRNQVEAEDILQEVFEELIESYDMGTAIETLGAWLVRVAQNKIIDRFRKKKSHERYEAEMTSQEQGPNESPDEELFRSFLREEIVEALDLLPEDQRFVFVQHELEGKSFEQISAETGVAINTLLSRKRYAVLFLRDYLKEIFDELE